MRELKRRAGISALVRWNATRAVALAGLVLLLPSAAPGERVAHASRPHHPTAFRILFRSSVARARYKSFLGISKGVYACSCGDKIVLHGRRAYTNVRTKYVVSHGVLQLPNESERTYFVDERRGKHFLYRMIRVNGISSKRFRSQWRCTVHWGYDRLWSWLPQWYRSGRSIFGYGPAPQPRILGKASIKGVPVWIIETHGMGDERTLDYISRRDYTLRESVTTLTTKNGPTVSGWLRTLYGDYGRVKAFHLPSVCGH